MNLFILRWNPNISSYKREDHVDLKDHIEKGEMPEGFNWSIREGDSLRKNDLFLLLQVGTENDGVAMIGKFRDCCYKAESWKKDGNTIDYADLWIMEAFDCENENLLSAEMLEKKFPEISWHGGHSGIPVEPELASRLFDCIETEMIRIGRWNENTVDQFINYDFEREMNQKPTSEDLADGTVLVGFKHEFLEDRNDKQKFINLICCIRDSQFLVPMKLKEKVSNKFVTKNSREETFEIEPVQLKGRNGLCAFAIFSNYEQVGNEYSSSDYKIAKLPYKDVVALFMEVKKNFKMVLDPFTESFVIDKDLVDLISELS